LDWSWQRSRLQRQTPEQGKDQQNDQDHSKQSASRAEDGVPATETVATAQQRQDQYHNKDQYEWTHGLLLTKKKDTCI
jgi:hypothetical protein